MLITPHTAGETRKYEDNVIDLLLENLDRLVARRDRAEERHRLISPGKPNRNRGGAYLRHVRRDA